MKPEEHILKLINATSDPVRVKSGSKRQIISFLQYNDPVCFILHEGDVSLYRDQDHLLMANLTAPSMLGINLLQENNPGIYVQARSPIRFEMMTQKQFTDAVIKNELWESLAYTFMFMSLRFLENHFISTGVSTYDLVRNNLLELIAESDDFRLATNACDYIQERTKLSRSGIMKMLGDLKKGGYIDLQRGVLISISNLPVKY